jgi:hypothetical protein
VRHVQVWCNRGDDVIQAKAARPCLYGEEVIIAPVQDMVIREDAGRVVGQWSVFPGVERVHIFRTPVEAARRRMARPQFRILEDGDNLAGFVDEGAERGRRYLYEVIAEVEVEGAGRLSEPKRAVVTVSTVLNPVTDLAIEQHGADEQRQFDVSWTQYNKRARVHVFCTRDAPRAGPEDGVLSVERLPSAGLKPSDELCYPPVQVPGGRVGFRNIPWPADWAIAYFTPVAVDGDSALVGLSSSAVRVGSVRDALLQERVGMQRLTFVWPEGAHSVLVWLSAPNVETQALFASEPLLDISAHEFKKPLGVRLPRALPGERASVLHLVPCMFVGGRRYYGEPTVLGYPGLVRVAYRVEVKRRQRFFGGRTAELTITSEVPMATPPPFVLVLALGRLPLSIGDGEPVPVVPFGQVGMSPDSRILPNGLGPQAQSPGWTADLDAVLARVGRVHVKSGPYFLRLFADLPAETLRSVAVLDPPVSSLRVS